jgi:hypothetical protein
MTVLDKNMMDLVFVSMTSPIPKNYDYDNYYY